MSNLLKQYGIKEVADVTFYDMDDKPILFLDSLKISTIEQSAEEALAQGGKGNGTFIAWDYGREITMTIEDALFSPKSMALMMGDGIVDASGDTQETVVKLVRKGAQELSDDNWTATAYYTADMTVGSASAFEYASVSQSASTTTININANSFSGVYKVVGDTLARDRDGKDTGFQIVIPKAKIIIDNSLTLEADGDPTVFNMSLRVLRPESGEMMSLTQYEIPTT